MFVKPIFEFSSRRLLRYNRTETWEGKKNREPSAKIELQDHQAQKEVLCGEQYNTGAGVSSTDDEIFTESRGDRDGKLLPRMPKDRLEVPETLGWNAPKPCESQPPSTYVSASIKRSGNRFGSADAQEIRKRPDPGVSAGKGEGLYAQLRLFQTDGAAHIAANKTAAEAEEQAIPARRLPRRKGAGGR